jgi:hypothetical protein
MESGPTGDVEQTGPTGNVEQTGDVGQTGPTGDVAQTGDVEQTGPTGDVGQTGDVEQTGPTGPPPLPTITIADILNEQQLVLQKEANDKSALDAIGSMTFDSLRSTLIHWASIGFPNAYTLMEVSITPPAVCSDGASRGLADYIHFCSGKTINEHVDILRQKLPDMAVSFANMGSHIAIVVSRA